MLRRKGVSGPSRPRVQVTVTPQGATVDRRTFLRNSGIAVGGVALASSFGPGTLRKAEAAQPAPSSIERRKTICPFCAVGCSIWAEVENGAWIGQEPAFESPVNMGTHCAKGAATRELAIGHRRLKYPTKLVQGRWQRVSWEQAIAEIGDRMLQIREESGPDSVYWLGSAKFSNEAAYLFRKFAALWGTNNVDHQARICHSTTVAGVANSFGYGAMTNSLNDIHNSKSIFLLGGNPAEAHPVSMLHLLRAKETGAKLIVVDPRFTRTAAHADEYVRVRTGTDVAFLWGVLWVILENGWEDKEYLRQRVFGFDDFRKVVADYPPDEVSDITGVPSDQIERVARLVAENRPGTLIWCMGLTQSTIGNNNTRAASIFQLALGNVGRVGGGTNIFRGHDNVQGATDLGVLCHTLPAYYGLTTGAWKHWARVWDVDYEWLKGRFASQDLMEADGIPVSRWFDGALEDKENLEQPDNVRAMVFWGHAPNSQSRGPDVKAGLEKVDLLVVVDPVPTLSAVLADRRDGVYLLPAGSTMEIAGSVTNSQRALQWREKVIEPMFEAKGDYEIMALFAEKLGFAEQLLKHIAVENGEPVPEDILREINRGTWTIGYTGQSPERLKLHMQHQDKFDTTTLLGMSGPVKGEYYGLPWPSWGPPEMKHPGTRNLWDPSLPVAAGGLPFRARWGVEHDGHNLLAEGSFPPGSEIEDGYPEFTYAVLEKLGWHRELTPRERLVIAAVAAGSFEPGMLELSDTTAGRRLREVLEAHAVKSPPPGENGHLGLTEGDSTSGPTGITQTDPLAEAAAQTYEAFTPENIEKGKSGGQDSGTGKADSGGGGEHAGAKMSDGHSFAGKLLRVNWKTDLSGGIQRVAIAHGCAPFGNGKARAVVWNFPDPIPVHREPLYSPRRDLVARYPTYKDRRKYRLPVLYETVQKRDFTRDFPLILTSGRLVEYEGGGDETRSNMWLAELQQEMFAEVNPEDARANGIADGDMIWLSTPETARIRVAAMITRRVGRGTVFLPFHFGGFYQGRDLSEKYPPGTVPYVVGEAANTVATYGYDVVTFMQETKGTLCRIEPA
ncbi:MAG: formate dehydrogenase subunit alpha [Thalassobaculum sp.]|uniref:formate dehydrogenase subunit alpha n=1 Tax=Thalassobaculum sp. TaxID=2022740 RepID=UPI0032EF0CE8